MTFEGSKHDFLERVLARTIFQALLSDESSQELLVLLLHTATAGVLARAKVWGSSSSKHSALGSMVFLCGLLEEEWAMVCRGRLR